MAKIDGKRVRVRGDEVQFRGGGYYIGWGQQCRVLLAPALGGKVRDSARYVVHHPDLWFITIFQAGYYFLANEDPTSNVSRHVNVAEFTWWRQRTDRLWVDHPYLVADNYPAGDPFAIETSYIRETETLVVTESGFVYFIGADGMDRCRIGWTSDPDRRPGELVRSSPVPLSYLALLPGSLEDEGWLQSRFQHLRLHDDWFSLDSEMLAYIAWAREGWRKPGEYTTRYLSGDHPPVGADGL